MCLLTILLHSHSFFILEMSVFELLDLCLCNIVELMTRFFYFSFCGVTFESSVSQKYHLLKMTREKNWGPSRAESGPIGGHALCMLTAEELEVFTVVSLRNACVTSSDPITWLCKISTYLYSDLTFQDCWTLPSI